MKPVIFHSEAEAEFERAIAYLEDCSEGLGRDMKARVEQAVTLIAKHPTRFGWLRDTGFRALRLKRFRYLVIYLELDDAIWVAAVAHEKQHPDYWRSRSFTPP